VIDTETEIFAATIWGEARGEPMQGKIAVGHVILNRTARAGWSNSIVEVCLQPKQFSCWNQGDPNYRKLVRRKYLDSEHANTWVPTLYISLGVLLDHMRDNTGGADHYHAKSIALPEWAVGMVPTVQIGGHIFYNASMGGQRRGE
jgi:spore germination cell wall hydrolase CwlJ-like protein